MTTIDPRAQVDFNTWATMRMLDTIIRTAASPMPRIKRHGRRKAGGPRHRSERTAVAPPVYSTRHARALDRRLWRSIVLWRWLVVLGYALVVASAIPLSVVTPAWPVIVTALSAFPVWGMIFHLPRLHDMRLSLQEYPS